MYQQACPGFSGRCTAPLLLDKRSRRVVSNESADIVRLLNGLHLPGCSDVDLRPASLMPQIEPLCETIYDAVNNGVSAWPPCGACPAPLLRSCCLALRQVLFGPAALVLALCRRLCKPG